MGHLTLATDDVDKVTEHLNAAGYPIIDGPKDATKPSDPIFRVRYAETVGPCGERIVFFKEYE